MLYEAMLLFGVTFIAGWLFSTLLQQRHALYLRTGQQLWQFLVLAVYFCWFWTHGGQTLAMKTWRIRLVDRDGKALRWPRALYRYLLCWIWFIPGLALAHALGATHWGLVLFPGLNILACALASKADPHGQFIHDRIAGTRLVSVAPLVAATAVDPATVDNSDSKSDKSD